MPHWRADDVTYYVNFRHRRPLDEAERDALLRGLIKSDGQRWDLLIACVLADRTELLATMRDAAGGAPHELSDVVEKVKRRVGKLIAANTGERFPPFYGESFDRIVRDDAELEARFETIVKGPGEAGVSERPGEYRGLWIRP